MNAHILVVDDEPDLHALVAQKFRRQIREGTMNFCFAHNGLEALELIDAEPGIDMVISDINMPTMDGLSLLQKLQEADRPQSTIIVSAYGDMANIRSAMNRGAFDFITKPIDLVDLETTIGKTLRHIGILREAERRQREAERARTLLSRYFSPNLAARLAKDGDVIELAGQRREVAALFTDIESFTAMAETMEPNVLGELLNGYLAGMTYIVFSHEGTVARVVGDALHVLFGAPVDQPDHAARAVACALDLDRFAQQYREGWQEKGAALGVTRIGINAGPAIVGNFGGGQFFDYTAYGDTINIAARLETANKQFGTRICVGENVARQVPQFAGRPVGDLMLRGRAEPIRAFELMDPEQQPAGSADGYLQAFGKLESSDPNALGAFAAEVGRNPGDRLSSFHLRRLLNGSTGALISLD